MAETIAGSTSELLWFATINTGPLAGKRVAVTRPSGERDELATLLAQRGAQVIDAPVVAIEPRHDDLTMDERMASRWDWIVLTSANAVRTFFDALAEAGKDARALGGARIAVIGPATARVVREFGVREQAGALVGC